MSLANRIKQVVDFSGMTIPQFSKFVGFKTPQTVRELLKGKTKSLSFQVKEKISSSFPSINMDWLQTGKGEMLRSSVSTGDIKNSNVAAGSGSQVNVDCNDTIDKALNEISEMRKLVQKRDEQIDRLITLLEKK